MGEILIVDDDKQLVAMLSTYLRGRGFDVVSAYDGESGCDLVRQTAPDAVVLDLMLPDLDGLEVCRRIRAESNVPIVMLTARGDEEDRIVGLELGADDYVPKPFNPRELLARLRAVLRRQREESSRRPVLRFGRLEIDRDARQAFRDGEPCDLTSRQFELLRVLAENAGRPMSREQLMGQTQGRGRAALDRSIDVHISRIRAAVEDDARRPQRIKSVRGVGYVFTQGPADEAEA